MHKLLNKPTIPVSTGEDNVQVDWNETDTASDAFILNQPIIPTVPSTYAPTDAERNVRSDWNQSNINDDAYILNKPTIPTDLGESNVQSD